MAIERVLLGETVATAVEKVNELIDTVVENADDIEKFKDGTLSVKQADKSTKTNNVLVNNIATETNQYPIALLANGVSESPVYVDSADLNYNPSTGTFSAPVFRENGTPLENKYATKDELNGIAQTAGKIDDVKVNGASVVSNKVANISVPTKVSQLQNDSNFIPASQKAVANGVASLDQNGKVPTSQLPSYVDDVLEYSSKSGFPATGETGKIYVDQSTNLTYRWGGSAYVEISKSLALGENESTAYYGDKGKKNREDINTLLSDVGSLKSRVTDIENNVASSAIITFSTSTTTDAEGYYTKTFNITDLDQLGENLSIDSFIPTMVLSGMAYNMSARLVDWSLSGTAWVLRSHIELTNATAIFIKLPNVIGMDALYGNRI